MNNFIQKYLYPSAKPNRSIPKRLLFYAIAFALLGVVFLSFSTAYQELTHFARLQNRSTAVYNGFQNLSRQVNNAAVINPELLDTMSFSRAGSLFYTDSSTVVRQLDSLKAIAKDSQNIITIVALDTLVRSELSWMLRSNVPDSMVHHRAAAHIAVIEHIDALLEKGMHRTEFLLATHKAALQTAMAGVEEWMIVFILICAILIGYTAINLSKQKSETERTQKAMDYTEAKYRHTLETMIEGCQIHDRSWRYIYVNDALLKYSQYTREQLMGYTVMEKYPGIKQTETYAAMERCMFTHQPQQLETEFVFPNGTKAHFQLSIQPIPEGIVILSVDITEKKKATEKLEKANRLYSFISAINQSIVHIKDEQILLDNTCKVAIDIGKFNMAWIAIADERGIVRIVSQGGDADAAKKILRTEVDPNDPALQHIPTVQMLKSGKYSFNNDVQNDPKLVAWREEFIAQGIYASISLPIMKYGKVIGILGLHAPAKDFFDQQEIALLEEAVGDISFALEVFDKEHRRALAEQNLRRREAQLKDAQAIGRMGSWEVDMNTGAIQWSDEHYNALGLKKGVDIPTNDLFLSMVHPDDVDRVRMGFLSTFSSLSDSTDYVKMRMRDGSIKYVFCEWKFEFDADKKPIRMYGITQDVTESKIAEEKLKLSSSIISSSYDAIISKTTDGIITSWNSAAEHILGYTAAEAIGSHITMLVPPPLVREEQMMLLHIMSGKTVDHYETQRIKKDGSIIEVSLTISPIWDASGQITGASKIMREITDKKRAEAEIKALNEQLQASNYQLSTIFNTLPANIALLDDSGKIIAVNKGWKQFADENELKTANHCLGYNYIEVCGNVMGDDAPVAREMARDMRHILKKTIPEFSVEYPCHSPRERRWFRAEVRPLTDDDQSGAVVMHVDITERKLAEEEVLEMNNTLENRVQERTSELREANSALEAFSYSVSHDLRAPVRAMIGFTSIIEKEYGKGFNEDLREMFGHISISSRRMNAIIDDMLTLAKYEKEKLRPAPVDMGQLFHDVWDSILFSAPHNALLHMAEMPTVVADSSMIQQVVTNLLSNAVKYSSKKERPVVEVGYELREATLTFYVRDNGAGFDMKNYSKLFGAFQRLHGSAEFEGTGVGLLLVKRIVERHGGIVWAEGKVNEGATFYFTLPVL